jgi:hypothetical protein
MPRRPLAGFLWRRFFKTGAARLIAAPVTASLNPARWSLTAARTDRRYASAV